MAPDFRAGTLKGQELKPLCDTETETKEGLKPDRDLNEAGLWGGAEAAIGPTF